jgi:hypothetical protein
MKITAWFHISKSAAKNPSPVIPILNPSKPDAEFGSKGKRPQGLSASY